MKEQKKKQHNSTAAVKLPAPVSFKKYYYLFGIITFFLFANTIGNDYNMDDGLVTRNHKLTSQGLSTVKEIFTSSYYDDGVYSYGYRPMVHLSFALEHELFGEKPGSGHFINIILFTLSVLLFFKLLVKWVGEKNILFAGIATLLFAVHPIHTEVVASLKNRDEILAFLFVIWAALSAHKFLEKGKFISLISILVLFSLAMLSKKSVYPMAIIIPTGILLLKELSVRQLVLITTAFVLPAAFIGSDFQLKMSILMTVIPLMFIIFTYLIKHSFLTKEQSLRSLLDSWIIPLFMSVIIFCFSIYNNNLWIMYFSVPFLIWLFKSNFPTGILVIFFLSIGLSIQFMIPDFSKLSLFISFGYVIYLYNKKSDYKKWIVLCAISTLYFISDIPSLSSILLLLSILLFFIVIYKKAWVGLTISTILCVATFLIFKQLDFFSFVILIFSIFHLIDEKRKNKLPIWTAIVPLLTFIGILTFQSYTDYHNQVNKYVADVSHQTNEGKLNSQLPDTSDPTLKEGRTLLYIENTLVVPHSTSEKIATGFSTLGEYLYLHIFPKELSFYYGFSKTKTTDFSFPSVWISIFIHLLLIGIGVWQIKKHPLIAVGVLWYSMSIILFSNWVELVAGMVGERLAFTASAGFCILIAGIIFWIKPDFNIKKPGMTGALLGIIILLFAGRTIIRNTNWKDSLTLMGHDIKHLSNSAQANNLYAMSLMAESIKNKNLSANQKLETQRIAISHFDQATAVWSDFYNAYIDKAKATMLTGDYQKGLEAMEQAKRIDPKNVLTYYVLLEITERNGDYKSYLKSAEELFQITQTDHAYGVVARGYFLLNNYSKSKEVLIEGITKHPESDVLKNNLRIVEEKMK